MRITTTSLVIGTLFTGIAFMQACGGSDGSSEDGSGGTASGGSSANGGTASGGSASGGSASGGTASNTDSGGTSAGGSSGGVTSDSSSTGSGASASGGTASGGATSGTSSGSGGAAGDGPIGPVCGSFGDDCSSAGDCCSEVCDPNNQCGRNVIECNEEGADCAANTDCCSFNCDDGSCSDAACLDDGEECTEGGAACCSGSCDGGVCADINGYATCKSSGNSCENDSDCCSMLCEGGSCSQKVSYCVQLNDICSHNADCCSGNCIMEDGAAAGYCGTLEVGPERCKDGQAGMVCGSDCAQCCSRACGPGPAGVFICQPPSGCRPAGELCVRDTDCCGGDPTSGLPGSGESDAFCERESADDVFGRCKSQRCTPQGDVCHQTEGLCSETSQLPSNCCPTNANPSNPNWKRGECEYDPLGIPRCNGLSDDYCVPEGGSCSNSGDCCDERPCVPDPDDNNRLKCGTKECNEDGDTCTTNADCCIGTICYIAAGEVSGSCTPPSPGTGGTGGSGTGGSGGSGTGGSGGSGTGGSSSTDSGSGGTGNTGSGGTGGTPCSAYSQTCSETSDCCDADLGVECLMGRCLIQN